MDTIQRFSGGTNSGITKYHRNICTSSGMLRNSSTQQWPMVVSQWLWVVRMVPMSDPAIIAISHATTETASVQPRPDSRISQ